MLPARKEGVAIDDAALRRALGPMLSGWLNKVGEREVENIKKDLSVPVEYHEGYVVRSRPGEPPRKDTGALQKGVHHFVSMGDNLMPELMIVSERVNSSDPTEVPFWLEFGKGRMKSRPYMRVASRRLAATLSGGTGIGAQATFVV